MIEIQIINKFTNAQRLIKFKYLVLHFYFRIISLKKEEKNYFLDVFEGVDSESASNSF